jgi:hypothetical protein
MQQPALGMERLARGGRQLLEQESLACLLVLLFVEDARMNTVKLHRVIRNLCIHGPSRGWIIRALLSILEKVSGRQQQQQQQEEEEGALVKSQQTHQEHARASKTSKSPGRYVRFFAAHLIVLTLLYVRIIEH